VAAVCVCADEGAWLRLCLRNETVRQILAIGGKSFAKLQREAAKAAIARKMC